MSDDLEAKRVEEQVLAIDDLVEVEACVLVLRDNRLLHALLLTQGARLVQSSWVYESVVQLTFRIDSTIIKMASQSSQGAYLGLELTLDETDCLLQVVYLITRVVSFFLGLVPLQTS